MKLFDLTNDISQTQENTTGSTTLTFSESGSTNITVAYSEVYKNSMLCKDSIDTDHPEMFSLEFGITEDSPYYNGITEPNLDKRVSTYKKYAKMLLDDENDKFELNSSTNIEQCFILSLARSLKSSEIQKGDVELNVVYSNASGLVSGSITDERLTTETTTALPFQRNINSEYRKLYFFDENGSGSVCGLIFYQPGIMILDPDKIFSKGETEAWSTSGSVPGMDTTVWNDVADDALLVDDYPTDINLYYGFINRIQDLNFTSITTEFYTNYFVKAEANEFNYSSNPTYVTEDGDIVIVGNDINNQAESYTYITGVGLYDNSENLLAVAKLSKPLRKDWSLARLLKVRVGN